MRILPSLRHCDVYAEGPELDKLEREVATIRNDFAEILREIGEMAQDPDWLHFRLENIETAIRLARAVKEGIGGVYIG